jgi:uncharacterized damage-inducible protein DinB
VRPGRFSYLSIAERAWAGLELFFRNETMLDYLQKLFVYDDWANREFGTALNSLAQPPSRSIRLLAHILSAERLWFERLNSQPQSLPVWPQFGLSECDTLLAEVHDAWLGYFRWLSESDLASTISYKNSKGERWQSRVEDILTHVVIHSAYHRGQIATDFRAAGMTPPYTDFIHAVRQQLVKRLPAE